MCLLLFLPDSSLACTGDVVVALGAMAPQQNTEVDSWALLALCILCGVAL